MRYFARKKAERQAKRDLAAAREARLNASLRESYNHPVYGIDAVNAATLYTSVASADVDHDEDVEPMADDTGREESAVDTYVAQD